MRRRVPMTVALSITFALSAAGLPAAAGDAVPPSPPAPSVPPPSPPAPSITAPPRARVVFHAPVDAPVSDPFRPPTTPYGPGNRGVDYATASGRPVVAAAGGVVTFAGQVGGTLNVVILHADAIRTSYSLLASLAVTVGQQVSAGQVIGTSGSDVHFGARAGRAYVDPSVLVQPPHPGRVRLLPIMGGRR